MNMRTSSVHTGSGRRRAPALAAAVTLLALAAAGCGSSSGSSSASGPSSTPPDTATATTPTSPAAPTDSGTTATSPVTTGAPAPSTAAPGGTPATSRPAPAPAASARCTVTDLKLRLGRGDPGAGQIYFPLTFTNITAHACVLDGYPGVSLLRGDGSVIGRPAAREPGRAGSIRLAPGSTVQADLHTLNQGVREGGCWRTPTFVKVYPPGSTDAMTLAVGSPVVCGDTFDVGPVH
ncbi:DUF4232 domain-containing protein [Streptomyces sp. KK5PA1]|uniref:DUF4232 domain-containing protein n=2 Tax=Actinacidiphila acididurans TaxID=2784346 RepID=A0ABS2TLK5_9ACTN|nr:DUF4232 domain-containing protein [Actinacidiphila acididurans]